MSVIPEFDAVDEKCLSRRLKYREVLQKDFRNQFKSEHLGLLIQRPNGKLYQRSVAVGDTDLIEADNKKMIN